ncbi:MAG TPA: hypothetical protein VFF44_12705 [Casimicrobiaceae bacterium]|nr:hypothetical protein [Casimicrobiaceae bacterium]
MLRKSPSPLRHLVTSLKVAALVTVLGTVVLAAERHRAAQVSPEEIVATDTAPNHVGSQAPSAGSAAAPAGVAPEAYFPSQFPEPTGEVAAQPPTF